MKTARISTILQALAAAVVFLIAAAPLHALAAELEAKLEARKVTRGADGREAFASAETAKPGDVIEYVATYRNTTGAPVRNLEATLPLPPHTELVAGSVRPASVKASLDAREFNALPLKRKAVVAGREVEETVPMREYRYLRWAPVDLGREAVMAFTARVRVLE